MAAGAPEVGLFEIPLGDSRGFLLCRLGSKCNRGASSRMFQEKGQTRTHVHLPCPTLGSADFARVTSSVNPAILRAEAQGPGLRQAAVYLREAIEEFRTLREMRPDFPRSDLIFNVYVEKGDFAECALRTGKNTPAATTEVRNRSPDALAIRECQWCPRVSSFVATRLDRFGSDGPAKESRSCVQSWSDQTVCNFGGCINVCITTQYCSVFSRSPRNCSAAAFGAAKSK